MNRTLRTFSRTDFGHTHTATAYTEDGLVWRWASNNAVCPLDACQDYGIPVDAAAQAAARDAELTAFVASYKAARRNRRPSAEERFELRAAFGPGQTVVNILTGERTRT
jgi:hypothetical protein